MLCDCKAHCSTWSLIILSCSTPEPISKAWLLGCFYAWSEMSNSLPSFFLNCFLNKWLEHKSPNNEWYILTATNMNPIHMLLGTDLYIRTEIWNWSVWLSGSVTDPLFWKYWLKCLVRCLLFWDFGAIPNLTKQQNVFWNPISKLNSREIIWKFILHIKFIFCEGTEFIAGLKAT